MKFKFILIIIASFLTSLIFIEIFVSLLVFNNPDFDIYPKGIVATSGSKTLNTEEGYARLKHTNSFGTYHEIDYSKPSIIYQGDSYTYSKQVSADLNYVSLIQNSSDTIQHINVGNFGTHNADYYFNKRYFDNLSVIHYFIQLRYNDFTSSFDKASLIHFKYAENQSNLVLGIGNNKIITFFKENFELYRVVNKINILNLLKEKYFNLILNSFRFNQLGVNAREVLDPKDFYIEKQLKLLKSEYGQNLTLIYLPMEPQIDSNQVSFEVLSEEEKFKSEIFKACEILSIDIIDLSSDFEDYYKKTNQFAYGFHNTQPGFGHMNEEGHKILANKILSLNYFEGVKK